MTSMYCEGSRIRDVVRDSKIRWDIPLKPNLMFDPFVTQPDRHSDGLGHHLYCDTQLFDGVFPHVRMAEVDRCCSVRERNRSRFRSILPTFDGSPIIEEFWEWVDAIDDYFEEMQPPDELKCKIASYTLVEEADRWWQQLQRERVVIGKSKVSSWPRMKRLLGRRFTSANYLMKVQPSVFNYKLGTEGKESPKQWKNCGPTNGSHHLHSVPVVVQKNVEDGDGAIGVARHEAYIEKEETSNFMQPGDSEKNNKDGEYSEEKNECNVRTAVVVHAKQEGCGSIKFLQADRSLPAKCLTKVPNESCNEKQDMISNWGGLYAYGEKVSNHSNDYQSLDSRSMATKCQSLDSRSMATKCQGLFSLNVTGSHDPQGEQQSRLTSQTKRRGLTKACHLKDSQDSNVFNRIDFARFFPTLDVLNRCKATSLMKIAVAFGNVMHCQLKANINVDWEVGTNYETIAAIMVLNDDYRSGNTSSARKYARKLGSNDVDFLIDEMLTISFDPGGVSIRANTILYLIHKTDAGLRLIEDSAASTFDASVQTRLKIKDVKGLVLKRRLELVDLSKMTRRDKNPDVAFDITISAIDIDDVGHILEQGELLIINVDTCIDSCTGTFISSCSFKSVVEKSALNLVFENVMWPCVVIPISRFVPTCVDAYLTPFIQAYLCGFLSEFKEIGKTSCMTDVVVTFDPGGIIIPTRTRSVILRIEILAELILCKNAMAIRSNCDCSYDMLIRVRKDNGAMPCFCETTDVMMSVRVIFGSCVSISSGMEMMYSYQVPYNGAARWYIDYMLKALYEVAEWCLGEYGDLFVCVIAPGITKQLTNKTRGDGEDLLSRAVRVSFRRLTSILWPFTVTVSTVVTPHYTLFLSPYVGVDSYQGGSFKLRFLLSFLVLWCADFTNDMEESHLPHVIQMFVQLWGLPEGNKTTIEENLGEFNLIGKAETFPLVDYKEWENFGGNIHKIAIACERDYDLVMDIKIAGLCWTWIRKTLRLFFNLVNGLDPPDDASTNQEQLEDEFIILRRDGADVV